jgi:hypothetical protein
MKQFSLSLLFIMILFNLGCDQNNKKKSSENSSAPVCSTPTVSVVGYELAGSNGTKNVAKFWKAQGSNVSAVNFTSGVEHAKAIKIIRSGSLVYGVGQESSSNLDIIKFWKYDGSSTTAVPISVVVTFYGAKATGMILIGEDVYISGNQVDGSSVKSVAKIWKYNASSGVTEYNLTNSSTDNEATDMILQGTDLYISGFNYVNYPRPRLWKFETSTTTTTEIDLSGGVVSASPNALAILGQDIYIAGKQHNGSVYVAKLWKYDGSAVTNLTLTTDATKASEALGILTNENKIHIVGQESNGNYKVAKLWNYDGTNITPITLGDGSQDTLASTLSTFQNKFYIYGTEENSNTTVKQVLQWVYDGTQVVESAMTDGAHDASVSSSSLVCE